MPPFSLQPSLAPCHGVGTGSSRSTELPVSLPTGRLAFSHPSAFIVRGSRRAGSWTAWAGVSEQAPSSCLCSQTALALAAFPAGLSCVRASCRQRLWAAPCLWRCLFGSALHGGFEERVWWWAWGERGHVSPKGRGAGPPRPPAAGQTVEGSGMGAGKEAKGRRAWL